jgi:hypothetical protein
MSNRESLHELIDTLPEAALESAGRVLQNYQTSPTKPRMDVEKMYQRVDELFRTRKERADRTGTGYVSARIGGGSFNPDGDGMASMSTMDGPALVNFEIRVFRGHRLELEERLRLSEDKKSLVYAQLIKGPQGKEGRYEIDFEVAEQNLISVPSKPGQTSSKERTLPNTGFMGERASRAQLPGPKLSL